MPLFELFRLTKAKVESAQEKKSSPPEDEVVELVWENGQISMQSQSSKSRNTPASCGSSASRTAQSRSPRTKEIGNGGNGSDVKMDGHGNTSGGVLNEIQVPVAYVDMGLGQDDDMVRWLGYPLDESLQTGYCSDFLPDVSEVTVNEQGNDVPNQTAFPFFHRRNSDSQSLPNSHTVSSRSALSLGQGIQSKIPTNEATRPGSGTGQSFSAQSNLLQALAPYHSDSMRNSAAARAACEESGHTPASVGCFPQKQDPLLPNNKSGLINFSHFLRPAALAKANLNGTGVQISTSRMGSTTYRAAASGSNPMEARLVELDKRPREEKSSCRPLTVVPSEVGGAKEREDKVLNDSVASDLPKSVGTGSSSKNNQKVYLDFDDSSRRRPDGEKAVEPVVACSSVCSGNSLEGPSDGPSRSSKRKHSDIQDTECHSEDVEEESTDTRKTTPSRVGPGSKRSRSAEVHNLSERRRRDRINEKMRALQELIPNCNKADKASMLDEAIEYLKALQLQVQIMSVASGYYMPPMMLPPGMQHMHLAHMAHYPAMGVGIGMGMEMGMGMGMNYGMGMTDMSGGSPRVPMLQVPPMHGTQFQGILPSGPAALHGRPGSRLHPLGRPSQGLAAAMPHVAGASLMSSPAEVSGCGVVQPTKNMESTKESSSKDPGKNISQATQSSNDANILTKQASDQQVTNDRCRMSDVVAKDDGELSEPSRKGAPETGK